MMRLSGKIAKRYQNASTFYEQLKLALEYQASPEILRTYSPLARPYFLNQGNRPAEPNGVAAAMDWGQVLCDRLYEAAAVLWGEEVPATAAALLAGVEEEATTQGRGPRYDFLILELNYFKRLFNPPPKTQAVIYNDILHISRTSHDRYLKEAVERLGTVLLQQLRPPLRLESPLVAGPIVGRDELLTQALSTLQGPGSVSLTGAGGMGKSALGAAIADAWQTPAVFWFTIRPGLNDRLNSLLFALGYFLHQQGASALWLQLIADEGKLADGNLVLGLVRADLETLAPLPLFCFDEMDLLRATDIDRPNPHHAQLLAFIESLRPHLALLLIGQRAVLETEITLAVERLRRADIEHWLQRLQIHHTPEEVAQLDAYTQGNPRLLTLCMTLHQLHQAAPVTAARAGESGVDVQALQPNHLASTLLRLPHTPALAAIWDRLRTRLSPRERQIMQALAVFRGPAPKDAWLFTDDSTAIDSVANANREGAPTESSATIIAQLQARHLIQEDQKEGIVVLPILAVTLYEELTVELRETYHIAAAHICAARGEFTEAAYHFWQGGQPEAAIKIWYPERQREIRRGQAGAALAVLEAISARRLGRPQQKQLALARGELYGLLGEPQKVVETLEQLEWAEDEMERIEALRMWGEALNTQGDPIGAQEKLQEGVYVTAYLLEQFAHLHVQRGLIHMQQREMKAAWHEATRARYYAENLQGAIQANLGNYGIARTHYDAALSLAHELNDGQATARTQYYLGIAAMQQHDLATAFDHYATAIQEYKRTGNRAQELYVRSNLAAAHLAAGDYAAAIREARAALAFCQRMNAPYWIAMNAANLAEAHFELGELAAAESYALQVIDHEEVDSYPYALYTLGSVRRQQQRFDDALHFYQQSARIAERNEDRFLLAYAHRGVGATHADQQECALARAAYEAALLLFRQLAIADEVCTTEKLIEQLEQ